ncbi:MAG: ABC transporter permease, partial [Betaproteobacteria bacterium]|nr:ABC transporter permease [Betaproteobacteria bacterium]
MNMLWLRSLLRGRWGRQLGSASGLAVTVALLATLGAFIASSAPTMARRALATLNLDWQLLLAPGANPQPVEAALRESAPIEALQLVGYADVAGLSAQSGGTTQTTGPGKALGLPVGYAHDFAQQIQLLQGSADGVLIASQTASNLHVAVGDTVTVQRMGLTPVDLKITGIVSLPNA